MERIIAMVNSVSSDSSRGLSSIDSVESMGLVTCTSASTSEDLGVSGEWTDREFETKDSVLSIANSSNQGMPYRMFFDSREKKLLEKIDFVKVVHKHRSVLFGECDGHEVTPRSKEEAWKQVAMEVESLGLDSYKGKPWARLRDHDWQYVRRHALARNENSHKPTGKLGELDRIVLEIITSTALLNSLTPAQTASLTVSSAAAVAAVAASVPQPEHVEKMIRNILASGSSDSVDDGASVSFDTTTVKQEVDSMRKEDTDAVAVASNDALIEYLRLSNAAAQNLPLAIDPNVQTHCRTLAKSPTPSSNRKITSRAATAPSVYTIPSSTSSPPQLTLTPPSKRPRIDNESSPSPSYERKKEALELRKMELEVKHLELLNEKLIKEIAVLDGQERRACELHALERSAKSKLLRAAAVDESIDSPN